MEREVPAVCPECNTDLLISIDNDDSSMDEIVECPYCLSDIRIGTAILRYKNMQKKGLRGESTLRFEETSEELAGFDNQRVSSLRCPNCGGPIKMLSEASAVCEYCNSPLVIDDGVVRLKIIDEARIKELDLESRKFAHESEYQRQLLKRNEKEDANMMRIIYVVLAVIILAAIATYTVRFVPELEYIEQLARGVFHFGIITFFTLVAIAAWNNARNKAEVLLSKNSNKTWADEHTPLSYFRYMIEDGSIHLTGTKPDVDLVHIWIPAFYVIDGIEYPVKKVGHITDIFMTRSLIIEEGIVELTSETIFGSKNMERVYLPSTIQTPTNIAFISNNQIATKLFYGGTTDQFYKICKTKRGDMHVDKIIFNSVSPYLRDK